MTVGADVKTGTNQSVHLFIGLDLLVIIAFSAFVLAYFDFASGSPLVALLFDSQGYLWISEALSKLPGLELGSQLLSYFSSGFAEAERLRLRDSLKSVADLSKAGPVLPALLSLAYAASGKAPIAANWSVGIWTMIACQSLTNCGIYLLARPLIGRKQAFLAGILAISYPAFIVNSGRILSEIPANLAVVTALLVLSFFLKQDHSKQSLFSYGGWGCACGAAFALMMLARPPLLLYPLLLLILYLVNLCIFKQSAPMKAASFISLCLGLLTGLSVILCPWALTKLIIIGQPSISVDRHGPYNLYTGLNLSSDGWDMLPGELVNHPERFQSTFSQVAASLAKTAEKNPSEFIDLLARKPARLMDSPWNDFQIPVFGIGLSGQRFFHQMLICLAALGTLYLLQESLRQHDRYRHYMTLALSGLLLYHLICCLFITMSRYFFTAGPALIVLAASGIAAIFAIRTGQKKALLFSSVSLPPIFLLILSNLENQKESFLVSSILAWGPQLNSIALGSLYILVLSLASITLVRNLKLSPRLAGLFFVFVCCASICGTYSLNHRIMTAGALMLPASGEDKWTKCTYYVPATASGKAFLLAIDASMKANNYGQDFLKLPIRVNQLELHPEWRPLLAFDSSQRESLSYLTAFAHSSGKEIGHFKLWYLAVIPNNLIKPGEENHLELLLDHKNANFYQDFADSFKQVTHSVDLRRFSWSKGFFADSPGEMRADLFSLKPRPSTVQANILGQSCFLEPRVRLLALSDRSGLDASINAETVRIGLGSARVDKTYDKAMVKLNLSNADIQASLKRARAVGANALSIKVSGRLKVLSQPSEASIALLETFTLDGVSHTEFAPLAPQNLAAKMGKEEERNFEFEDLFPLERAAARAESLSLELLISGRNWWDILSYGQIRPRNQMDFQNITVSIQPIFVPNLDKLEQMERVSLRKDMDE